MRGTPALSIPELAGIIGVTERSIERNIQKRQRNGMIRRIGPAKGVPVAADGPEISGSGRSDRNRVLVSAGRGGRHGAVSVGDLSGQEGVGKGTEAGKAERGHPEASAGMDRRAQE